MKKLLILAVALRLFVAGFLFHPDIKTYNFQASFLKKGVFDIYSYLTDNKKALTLKDDFVYFPLTYFTVGGYQWIASPILGKNFDFWLANADSVSAVRNPNIFKYLIILKLPYLILDLGIAFLLKRFFDSPAGRAGDKEKAEKAFTFWLFNPFTIFLIYGFSNIDIYAVLLTVIAFLLLKKDKLLKASVLIGFAAAFKLYPIIFIPFLVLESKNLKEKILVGTLPFLILAATILPFWSPAFVQSALVSGLTTRIFNPGFSVGFGESIIVSLLIISAIFFFAWLNGKKITLFNYWVVIILSIFSFSHFHIAWLMWLAPFLIILAVKNSKMALPIFLLSLAAIFIPMLYEDRSMTISLFRIYSTWYDLLPTPFSVIEKFYDPYNLQSILHSVLAGGSVILGYKLLREDRRPVGPMARRENKQ